MQGTVASFDPAGGGTVRLDDGSSVGFGVAAFAASGLRLLRPGQRVRLERDAAGVVVLVTLPTLGTLDPPAPNSIGPGEGRRRG